jgi:plastocyanin
MRTRRLLLLVTVLTQGAIAGAPPARADGPTILISNFRFCGNRPFPCDPADMVYVPDPNTGAPAVPVYIPFGVVNVKPGDIVTFLYNDSICDAISGCPGHQVQFVDGPLVNGSPIKTDGGTITFTVPADWQPGADKPYFCPVGGAHYKLGMTGMLHVTS